MYNLGSTADLYLSPALEVISDKLSCSESLAGVTLLALGNGAPDVFSSISAGGTTESAVNLQVSALAGSALFITCVVMWLSIRASTADDGRIKVTKIFFVRDSIFIFLAALYVLVVLFLIKHITIPVAAGFIALYLLFVIIVVVQAV
jgi:sodium/potassium/calcium exchanger 6